MRARLADELRKNTSDPATGNIVVSSTIAQAIQAVSAHYIALFGSDPSMNQFRKDYAIPDNSIPSIKRRQELCGFFFRATNIGLVLMVTLSLPPVGLLQAYASMTHGSVVRSLGGISADTDYGAFEMDESFRRHPLRIWHFRLLLVRSWIENGVVH